MAYVTPAFPVETVGYLEHSAKGTTWKNHKYISKKNGRYIYPKKSKGKGSYNSARSKKARDKYGRVDGGEYMGPGTPVRDIKMKQTTYTDQNGTYYRVHIDDDEGAIYRIPEKEYDKVAKTMGDDDAIKKYGEKIDGYANLNYDKIRKQIVDQNYDQLPDFAKTKTAGNYSTRSIEKERNRRAKQGR